MTDTPLQGGITKTQSWFSTVSQKYSAVNKISLATKVLKSSINAGEAIINLLSNTGIAGFKFQVPQTELIKLESDITDYYTDVNSNIQDHIVRKPITVTVTGLVGEYFYSVNEIEDMLASVVPTFRLLQQFVPQLTAAAKQGMIKKYNARSVENLSNNTATNNAVASDSGYQFNFINLDLFNLFQNLYKLKSAQTRAYFFFEALWRSQALFTVETSWKKFDNMAVQSITPRRDNNADITEFQATFKQINFTQTMSESAEAVAGRMKEQTAEVTSKGETKGEYKIPTKDLKVLSGGEIVSADIA